VKLLLKVLICSMLILALIGCKKAESPRSAVEPKAPAASKEASDDKRAAEAPAETGKNENIADSKRKLIKEGELTFETSDMGDTASLIQKAVKDSQGYIARETQENYGVRISVSLLIRVPHDRFESLLNDISSKADVVDRKKIETKEVTEEYVDLKTRLKTRRDLENRYLQLLKQANKVEDILKIEKQIGEIREKIEAAEGRLKYLNDRIDYSTLTVVYYKRVASSRGFGLSFVQGLGEGWTNFEMFIVVLAKLWPFVILLIIVIIIIKKIRKKRREAKAAETKDQSQ
jgi:hypothetical protein